MAWGALGLTATANRPTRGESGGACEETGNRLRVFEQESRMAEVGGQQLWDLLAEGILVHLDGRIEYANGAAATLLGYSRPELLLSGNSLDLVHPRCRGREEQRLRMATVARQPVAFEEVPYVRVDGTETGVQVALVPCPYQGRSAALAVLRNVGARDSSKAAVEPDYRSLFDNAFEGIFQSSLDGRVLAANSAFARILGYSSWEQLLAEVTDVITQIHVNPRTRAQMIEELVERGGVHNFECQVRCRDGSLRWVSGNARIVKDPQGKPLHLEGSVQNITERKQMEAHLRQMQKVEAIGTLAGGIAHDFNNILAAIMGYLEMAMLDCPDHALTRTHLQGAVKASREAKQLVRQIQAFSREGGSPCTPVHMGDTVRKAMEFVKLALPASARLETDLPDGRLVMANPARLEQMVMNLCRHAALAMPGEGRSLRVTLTERTVDKKSNLSYAGLPDGTYAQLTVGDLDTPAEPGREERVFDPYLSEQGAGNGDGLCLAVVHGIVKRLGGAVVVRGGEEQACGFTVLLPTVEDRCDLLVTEPPACARGTERLLIVEGAKALLEGGPELLAELGYRVETRKLAAGMRLPMGEGVGDFDVVVADREVWPELDVAGDGEDLPNPAAGRPVVLCMGFSENLTAARMRKAGIRELVKKPVVLSDLASAIRRAIDEGKAPTA